MSPLPAELASALEAPPTPMPKRERTRRQLLIAALRQLGARGVAATTLQQIAQQAEMTTATVYNHFASKDELLQAVAVWLADTLCRRIGDSYAHIPEGAERMAIGNKRYLWLAETSPAWARLLLDVAAEAPALIDATRSYMLADLRLGLKQKAFKPVSEAAAADLIAGTISQAMRMLIAGAAPRGHAQAVSATVLIGLGMERARALEVAARPLPPFVPAAAAPATTTPLRKRSRA